MRIMEKHNRNSNYYVSGCFLGDKEEVAKVVGLFIVVKTTKFRRRYFIQTT